MPIKEFEVGHLYCSKQPQPYYDRVYFSGNIPKYEIFLVLNVEKDLNGIKGLMLIYCLYKNSKISFIVDNSNIDFFIKMD